MPKALSKGGTGGNIGQASPFLDPRSKSVPLPPSRAQHLGAASEAPAPPPVDPGKPVVSVPGQCGPVDLQAKDKVDEAKLDVLFVVDTSASLRGGKVRGKEGELAQIAAQMGAFVDAFPEKTDIRIAVMLGHGTGHWVGRLFTSGRGDPAVLKVSDFGNDRARLARLLKEKMQAIPPESEGAQGEALMYSLYQSVNKANLRAEIKKNFYRDDAALAVIFVTDEQDVCYDYKRTGQYTPVGKIVKNRKGEVISKVDPVEEKFFNKVCQSAGPGKEPLTEGLVFSAIQSLKQNEKVMLFGIVYTDEKLTPKPGREDENEMGHGIIDLVNLQDDPKNRLADLNTVQEGPNKFGPELAFFADLAKKELASNGKVTCQPKINVMAIDTRTVVAQLLNEKGQTIGVFSEDCKSKNCGAGRGGMNLSTRKNSHSPGYLHATLDQKALNGLLNAHRSANNKVLFTFMTRTDRDVETGQAVDPNTGKTVSKPVSAKGNPVRKGGRRR